MQRPAYSGTTHTVSLMYPNFMKKPKYKLVGIVQKPKDNTLEA